MKEALCSSETSLLTRATRRNNPEDAILHNHVTSSIAQSLHPNYIEMFFWNLNTFLSEGNAVDYLTTFTFTPQPYIYLFS
jgi:hypothetical protein